MAFRFKPTFSVQFLILSAIAVSVIIFAISPKSKETVTHSLRPDEYRITEIGEWHGTPRNPSDKLYLLDIGSPRDYFVQLSYYDSEVKQTVSHRLNAGVRECVLRVMRENSLVFAHDLRDLGNSCYLPVRFSSNYKKIDYWDDDYGNVADNPAWAMVFFYHDGGVNQRDNTSFHYGTEDAIKRKCDSEQLSCVWVTLEPVVTPTSH